MRIRDALPGGFRIPTAAESAAQLNLSVTDGTGAAILFNDLGSGLFDPAGGIELVDPGPTIEQPDGTDGGALDQFHATNGRNVLIVTYDLIADVSVVPNETLTNTVTLFNYAGAPGGPDFTAEDPVDDAQITIASPAIDKTIAATNQSHTAGNNVAIGEIVTYEVEITIPEGTTTNVSLVDLLDSGLAFVGINGITAPAGVSTDVAGGFPGVAAGVVVSASGGGAVNQGRQITLDFGNITNADTNNAVAETIVVSYDVVVLNSGNNNRGGQRNNRADWRWEDDFGPQQLRDSAPNVRIVEPTLRVTKTAVPTSIESGDTLTYTLFVSHLAESNAGAFDVNLTDVIPANLQYVSGTLASSGLAPDVLTESAGTVTAVWDSFPLGSSSLIQFDVVALPSIVAGSQVTNTGDLAWTSLPGDATTPQSTFNSLSTERTGDTNDPGSAANDYVSSDSAAVTVPAPGARPKTIQATSEIHTDLNDVAIGEIVRYRLQIELIQGVQVGLQLVDRLPDGLILVDPDTVRISFTSDNPVSTAPDLAGANNGSVPPTFTMPASRITGSQTITFDFGTLLNTDSDANEELLTLEFNALVTNTSDTNDGDVKTNVFDLLLDGVIVSTSNPVDVIVREPSITDLDKQIVGTPPSDAGDPVTYQVTYSNTGSTSAFDVRLLDVLDPTSLSLSLPPTVTLSGGATGINDNSSGNTLDVTINEVPVGGAVTIEYTASLTYAVQPGQPVPNTADLTYTSLPGLGSPSLPPNNPTGSQTPGSSGDADGERNGSGGVNDYSDSDSESVTIVSPQFSKSLVATNQAHTMGLDVAIGEIVTYQAVITVPEGTMPDAQVVDLPDTGLAFVAVDSIVGTSPNITTSIPGGFAQVVSNANASIPVDGSSLTIDLGTLTNTDSDANAETLTITYRAVVLNTLANGRGFALDNAAGFTWSRGTLVDQAETVTIVEPTLDLTKLNGNPILGDAGDVITFQLQLQHAPGSDADAFDVLLEDVIDLAPNKMTYVPGSINVVNSGGAVLAGPPLDLSGNLFVVWSEFPQGASSIITFDVTLDITVGLNELLTNQADVFWTSLPGDVTLPQSSNPFSVERTGDAAGPGEPGANDYRDVDSGLVGTPTLDFSKEVVDSSESSTGSGRHVAGTIDLTIGETVTYALITGLPDGTFPNVVVLDNLPKLDGTSEGVLEFVSASLAFVGSDITDGMGNPLVLPAPVLTDTNGDGVNDRVEFNFGTIVNTPDANGISEDDQFVVAIVARVLNTLPDSTPVNFDGDTLNNFAQVNAVGLPAPLDDAVDVEIVEPALNILKDVTPTMVDGGDTVTFTLTVDHLAASTADAFDVTITDVLPAGLTYAGNIQVLLGAGPSATVAGQTVTFFWSAIPLGAPTYRFTFDATVDATITPSDSFTNVADLQWSTLPGPDAGERVYDDSDPAETITSTVTARNPVKSLVATSESSMPGNDVAVGEIVRYRLQFEISEGTLPNLRMIDTLDTGLRFVDPSQVFVSFTSDVAMGADADLLGANNGDVPPTHPLDASRITVAGQQVTFDLSTIVNNDDDPNAELVTLEYNVLVENSTSTNDGDVLGNLFEIDLDGMLIGPVNPGDNSVDVTVREPAIADVDKSVLTIADGRVAYQVIFSNTGTATAFDTRLVDLLPAQLALDLATVSATLFGGATGADTSNSTGNTVDVRIQNMPVGSQVVVAYAADVIASQQTISNTANVTYTSLPGPNGTLANPTGSQTPGGSGDLDGERNGQGGVNDYLDTDPELLGSLGDFVWNDLNGDGVQDIGEPGLPNVTVTLTWPGGNGIFGDGDDVTLTTTTDVNGGYAFSGLPAGQYRLEVDTTTVPAGLVNSFDRDGDLDSQVVVSLPAGQIRVDVDFGYVASAEAGGLKWNDANADGVRDSGEGPLAGVTIFVDLNDNRVFEPNEPSVVTDAAGAYQFDSLLPGDYVVREVPPVGYQQTFPANFEGYAVTLAPGQTLTDQNFGNTLIPAMIINDFDAEFDFDDGWDRFPYCVGHYGDDATTAPPGTGELTARWVFSPIDPGFYRVSATWLENPTGATNTPYTLMGGSGDETVRVNQILSPADHPNSFVDAGMPWMDLDASYEVLGDTLIVEISNDADGLVIADAIRIERLVNPEIAVLLGSTDLTSGQSAVDFGATAVGAPVTLTFTVENLGGFDLHLAEPIQVPAGYTVVNSFGSTTVLPGQTTTFDVRLDASQPGVFSGDLVLYNSDNNENPFTFPLSGSVDSRIIDDSDLGFSTVGAWTPFVGAGYQGDMTFSEAGLGGDVATWSFTGLTPGATYQVSSTWVANANRASNAPYTVLGGATPVSRSINQRVAPDDFQEDGFGWENLAQVTVTGSTLQVQLADNANGFVVADAVRVVPVNSPEIEVEFVGGPLTDGVSSVDFGDTVLTFPQQKTFTVRNIGTQPLTLADPIAAPTGFLVSGFGQTTLNPGVSTTFTVTLPATLAGSFSGQIVFGNNDPDENPFSFTVSGNVSANLPPIFLDDGDTGFSTVGNWTPAAGLGYQNDVRFSAAGGGSEIATWTFDLPIAGTYRVSVTWPEHPNRATNAPYSVNGSTAVLVNQQVAPADFIESGTAWHDLGNFVSVGTTMTVTLNDLANGYVMADGVRLERIASPEIRVTADRHLLEDDVSVLDFGAVDQGASVSLPVRIMNIGTEPLRLDSLEATGGFRVGSLANSVLPPETATTILITIDAVQSGLQTGSLRFRTNDSDESRYDIGLRAEVSEALLTKIVDNGDAGFHLFGNWTAYGGLGFGQDLLYSAGGLGLDYATWSFSDLPAGGYRVAATWPAHSNRGSTVPYSVNGSAETPINQRVAPDDFVDAGAGWEVLGDFLAVDGQIVVRMSDKTDGYVIADAVRIEFVQPLRAMEDGAEERTVAGGVLTEREARRLLPAAIEYWRGEGAEPRLLDTLQGTRIGVIDLPGGMLGGATADRVFLDWNGAGRGWMAGSSPGFVGLPAAFDGFDPLTVLAHELGHLLGYPDRYDATAEGDLMAGHLAFGTRLVGARAEHARVLAADEFDGGRPWSGTLREAERERKRHGLLIQRERQDSERLASHAASDNGSDRAARFESFRESAERDAPSLTDLDRFFAFWREEDLVD